jgi:hypothetical protein
MLENRVDLRIWMLNCASGRAAEMVAFVDLRTQKRLGRTETSEAVKSNGILPKKHW